MKKNRQLWAILKYSPVFSMAAYCAVIATMLCGGCTDDAMGTAATSEDREFYAPSNVTATAATSSISITVSWSPLPSNSDRPDGYRIYRSTSDSGTYSAVGTAKSSSYMDGGLLSGTVYYYKVSAYSSKYNGSMSSIAFATTIPAAPSGVNVSATSLSGITMSWSSATGAAGYNVYRSTSSSGTYSLLTTTTSASYADTGLSSNTSYYYKVSSYNNTGEGSLSSPLKVSTLFKTTTIGGKVWMAENLNNDTANSRCYDGNADNCTKYGKLYDWETATKACPAGWHLPSRGDWIHLAEAVGGQVQLSDDYKNDVWMYTGTKLKSKSGWVGINGTDDFGFAAMPGGYTWSNYSSAGGIHGYWWTATEGGGEFAYYWKMSYDGDIDGSYENKSRGLSVRCVQNSNNSASSYTVTVSSDGSGAIGGGNYTEGEIVVISAGTPPSGRMFSNWTTSSDGVIFSNANNAATTFIMPTNAVTVTAVFVTLVVAQGNITDSRDGTIYKTVKIGKNTWMAENLNYQTSSGSWCYDNSYNYKYDCNRGYGRLYNWATAMDIDTIYNSSIWGGGDVAQRGICPMGWHLPSLTEWYNLISVTGGNLGIGLGSGGDDYGFSARAGGYRDSDGRFLYIAGGSNVGGYWWTATEDGDRWVHSAIATSDYTTVSLLAEEKKNGYSVRCVEDGEKTSYAVTVSSAGTGAGGDGNYLTGSTVTIKAGTPPIGQCFSRWSTASSGVTFAKADSNTTTFIMPTNAVTVTAVFEPIIITFDPRGGSVSPTFGTIGDGWKLASLPTPTRSGDTFSGWFTAENGGTQVTTSYVFSANATIYARWTINSYTITFNANGGTVTSNSGTTGDGWKLVSLPTPTRNGYTFGGWFTAETGGTQVTTNYVFSANTTIYARWTLTQTGKIAGVDLVYQGQTYPTVVIGSQTWMAKNLNYATSSGSWCRSEPDSCTKYGRLYDWATAMNINSSYNSSTFGGGDVKRQGICPTGWHLPSRAELDTLVNYVGGYLTAGKKLKSTSGWFNNGNGTDDFGFSALPGGYCSSVGGNYFTAAYDPGRWWTATERDAKCALSLDMVYGDECVFGSCIGKSAGLSVRCVLDY